MEEKKYIPINCDLYDELEILAMHKQHTIIVYTDRSEEKTLQEVLIKNVYTREKVEYLLLGSGLEIRLDQLLSVDGKPFTGDRAKKC